MPASAKTRPDAHLTDALVRIGEHFEAATGTLHIAKRDALTLVASFGVPDSLLPVIKAIPFGKGIAGVAAQRREPVTICNIQTDASGITRPGARTTGVEGAIAVPILDGEKLIGVLGIGKAHAHEYSATEIEELCRRAKLLIEILVAPGQRRGVRRRARSLSQD